MNSVRPSMVMINKMATSLLQGYVRIGISQLRALVVVILRFVFWARAFAINVHLTLAACRS